MREPYIQHNKKSGVHGTCICVIREYNEEDDMIVQGSLGAMQQWSEMALTQ